MPEQPLVRNIQVIAVYVTDLSAAKAFYTDILGFEAGAGMPPGLLLHSGEATIYLEPGRKPATDAPATTREVSAVFGTESVAAARNHLQERGVTMVGEYQQFSEDFAFFRFADPDGNVHEFGGRP